ncbi:MAG: family 20 glycosylhydrolase [Bacteroidota bacterium]
MTAHHFLQFPFFQNQGTKTKTAEFLMHGQSYLVILYCLLLLASCTSKESEEAPLTYDIIPKPTSLVEIPGFFVVDQDVEIIVSDESLKPVANQLKEKFAARGLELEIVDAVGKNKAIIFEVDAQVAHEEGYHLTVTPTEITIRSSKPAGAFYAFQTLRQLSPKEIEENGKMAAGQWKIPAVEIKDAPRFSYRGMHLDVARHFFPVEAVKEYIDQLAYHKMNRFHWHLTEDQGWRLEILNHPKLTEVGAFRKETLIGHANDRPKKFDGKRYGGFYTQEEAREIVRYATERYITVIPEIEMPGHSTAALAAYPELACTDGPFEVITEWGVFEDVYCPKPYTFQFLEDVLAEVMAIFPSEYIHIGGDECPKTRWKESEFCQELIKKEGLKDEHGLQSYFIKRIESFLNAHGRNIIGWDEILEGGLAPNATVMSWRGVQGGIEAARQGHDVIMTPTSHCYFDYYQADHPEEPLAIGGFLPLSKVYSYEPVPKELNAAEAKHILGAQGNVWTEYIPTREHLFYMALPRMSAMAEVNWTPANQKDYDDFTERLTTHIERLNAMNIQPANHIFDVKMKITSGNGDGVQVMFSKENKAGTILFSVDGKPITKNSSEFSTPILLSGSTHLTAQAFDGKNLVGRGVDQQFNWHKAAGKTITFKEQPAERYSAGGTGAVINGVRGNTVRYGDAEWLGFEGKHAEAIIDFGEADTFKKVTLHFFKGEAQWIYLPKNVSVYTSDDKEVYTQVGASAEIKGDQKVITVPIELNSAKGRYMKVLVQRFGLIPDGKQGAGHEAWLFIDEIIVE